MIDVAKLLRQGLIVSTKSLYAQVGARVYAHEAPDTFTNAQKAVVVQLQPGMDDDYVDEYQIEVIFRCYGGSNDHVDAMAVYGALHDTWRGRDNENQTLGEGTFLTGSISTPQPLRDPDTEWPFVLATATALVRP